jgi:hypothetical protein
VFSPARLTAFLGIAEAAPLSVRDDVSGDLAEIFAQKLARRARDHRTRSRSLRSRLQAWRTDADQVPGPHDRRWARDGSGHGSRRGVTATAFVPRLREIGNAVDPTLQLREVASLDVLYQRSRKLMAMTALGVAAVTLSVLLLAAAGIYSLMSFTVAQRYREIGIRSALGADPRRILASMLSRALWQLGIGVVVGIALAVVAARLAEIDITSGRGPALLPAVAAFMMAIGVLAAVGPARRGLRIDPTEALRAE